MVLRRLVAASLLTFGLGLGWGAASAQVYPDRLIKVIVPFVPGSPVDAAARVITQHIQTRLGQNMVIENKPGGGTTIGLKAVMAAPTDGYTLLFIGPNLVYTPVLYPSMNFDPFRSLAPVASVVSYSHVMVVAPAVPAANAKASTARPKARFILTHASRLGALCLDRMRRNGTVAGLGQQWLGGKIGGLNALAERANDPATGDFDRPIRIFPTWRVTRLR